MSNAMDFNKIRKKRRRAQLVKRIGVLLGIALTVLVILSLNDMLVQEGIITQMRDFFGGFGGDGYPISAPGGVLRDVMSLDGDVAVLNDTNLILYNKKGKELLNLQRMNDKIVALAAGGRILTYELGGTKYKIYTRQSLLLESECESAITAMALGERGDFAVVSSSKQYTAQVTVYNPRFDMEFQWFSNELVVGAALHPKGRKMAAAGIGACGGEMHSYIYLFAFDSDKELAKVDLAGQLVLWISYLDDSKIGVLTDKSYHIIDGEGRQISEISLLGERPTAIRSYKGDVLLLCENTEARSQTLLRIDCKGNELGKLNFQQNVRDIQMDNNVYLLVDQEVIYCDKSLNQLEKMPALGVNRILTANQVLYAFTSEEIYLLKSLGIAKEGKTVSAVK